MLQTSICARAPAGNGPGWTDTRTERLKQLWADGLSASQIATKLGEITRNAVIGKVHRLGLAGRATTSRVRIARPRSNIALFPARSAQIGFGRGSTTPICRNTALKPQARPLRALPELGLAPDGLIILANLEETMCHWPVGDPKEEGFHFCGRNKSTGIPYCGHHAAIAYNPAARRRRDA